MLGCVCREGTGSSCATHERGSCRGCVKGRCLLWIWGVFPAETEVGVDAVVGLGSLWGASPADRSGCAQGTAERVPVSWGGVAVPVPLRVTVP